MGEYVSRFYILLQHAVDFDNEHRQFMVMASSYPYMDKENQREFMNTIKSKEELKPATIKADREKLRKLLRKT